MTIAANEKKSTATNAKDAPKGAEKPLDAKQSVSPATAAPAGSEADKDDDDDETPKRRGVIPTMPAAIIYRLKDRVYAAIHSPVDGTSYVESGKGEGSAKGALEDSGFRLSAVYSEGKEWIRNKLPEGATLIGYADIKGFPLPKQE